MVSFFRRRPRLAAGSRPALEPGERILAWAAVADDGVLVATNRGLWLPEGLRTPAADGPGTATRRMLGWHEIHKAAWSGQELRITPAEVAQAREAYQVLVDGPVLTFVLPDPGDLPDQVRARVSRSVAYTTHHPMPAGGVRVVGRRVSGQNGVTWAVRYDAGTPVELSSVVELTDELVAAAQGATAPPD